MLSAKIVVSKPNPALLIFLHAHYAIGSGICRSQVKPIFSTTSSLRPAIWHLCTIAYILAWTVSTSPGSATELQAGLLNWTSFSAMYLRWLGHQFRMIPTAFAISSSPSAIIPFEISFSRVKDSPLCPSPFPSNIVTLETLPVILQTKLFSERL